MRSKNKEMTTDQLNPLQKSVQRLTDWASEENVWLHDGLSEERCKDIQAVVARLAQLEAAVKWASTKLDDQFLSAMGMDEENPLFEALQGSGICDVRSCAQISQNTA